jgi:hypothetical protein
VDGTCRPGMGTSLSLTRSKAPNTKGTGDCDMKGGIETAALGSQRGHQKRDRNESAIQTVRSSSGVLRTGVGTGMCMGVGRCQGGRSRAHTAKETVRDCNDIQSAAILCGDLNNQRRVLKTKGISNQAEKLRDE